MGLIYWLPLIDDGHNQGLIDTTFSNTNVVFTGEGKLGNSAVFQNSLLYTDGVSVGNIWTTCWWAKAASDHSGYMFQLGTDAAVSKVQGAMRTVANHTDQLLIIVNKNAVTATVDANWLEWNHYTLQYDGTQIRLYINGELQCTQDWNYTYYAGTRLSIGCYYSTSNFDGMIQDFRLYDTVLSLREIKEISKGLVLHYPLSNSGGGCENLMKSSNFSITSGSNTSTVKIATLIPVGTTITVSVQVDADDVVWDSSSNYRRVGIEFWVPKSGTTGNQYFGTWAGQELSSSGNVVEAFTGSFHGRISKTFTTLGEVPALRYVGLYIQGVTSGTVRVSNPKVEIGSVATPWIPNAADTEYSTMGFNDGVEYDVSGYGYNGTKTGTFEYDADTPRYNTSTVFDGTTHIINNTSTIHLSNEFTISWWGKINTWRQVWEGMFLLQNTTALNVASGTYSIANAIHASTAGLMTLTLRQGGTTYPFDHYNWTYTVGVWSHYACTYKDGVIIMYQNGVQTYTATIDNNSSGDYYYTIGKRVSNCNCQMSDFRIYNTALSADDILELYHTPISLSNNGALLTQGEYVES